MLDVIRQIDDAGIFLHNNETIIRNRLYLRKYTFSVQASKDHHCTPRKNYNSLINYQTVEIALMDRDTQWIELNHFILKDFPKLGELKKYKKHNSIFHFVPITLVDELYRYLKDTQ